VLSSHFFDQLTLEFLTTRVKCFAKLEDHWLFHKNNGHGHHQTCRFDVHSYLLIVLFLFKIIRSAHFGAGPKNNDNKKKPNLPDEESVTRLPLVQLVQCSVLFQCPKSVIP
jgi:hypothetical protein